MTTDEALALLDKVAQAYTGNRADHVKLQEAINVLTALAHPAPKKEKK